MLSHCHTLNICRDVQCTWNVLVCTWYSVGIWKIRYYDVNSVVTVHSVLIYIAHGSQTIYNARILQ